MLEFAPGLAARNHRTDSIDYIVVLSGEIEMELDDTVVQLKAGDVMVQRGTIHNWVNRGTRAVRARGHPHRRQAGRGRRQGSEGRRIGREAPLAAGRLTTTPPAVRVFYSPTYVGSGYGFDTTRKAKWIADSLAESPISGIGLLEPRPMTREQVAQVHDAHYVRAVETGAPRELAESQGFQWDAGLWPMVLASNGGAVAAALAALEDGVAGSLSSGLHHARRGRGAGFCTFNGLVMAAREALTAGARSVLVLDLDAHCGGGTRSMNGGGSPYLAGRRVREQL